MSDLTRYSVECRAQLDGNTLVGTAIVYGQLGKPSDREYEQIAPEALDEVLTRSDTDVVSLWNHDERLVLGRQSAGTLRLRNTDEGLNFENDLPDTSYAQDLRALVARGDLRGASFGAIPDRSADEFTTAPDGLVLRTMRRIKRLRDLSPVTFPSYSGAAVALRAEDFRPDSRSQLIRARHRALHALGRGTE